MNAAEAHAAAAAEGLTLLRAENTTGFKNVSIGGSASKPFKASLKHGGSKESLGSFATAEAEHCGNGHCRACGAEFCWKCGEVLRQERASRSSGANVGHSRELDGGCAGARKWWS